MLAMEEKHQIRDLYYHQGIENISEIARITGFNRKTVTKYLDMEDFSPPPPIPEEETEHASKPDPYKPLIDSWLISDKKAPRKQRHTAKRVYRRLKKGYLQLNYGENMECLLESLVAIFEHIGGVPSEIWFDNTSTIVTKVIKGGERKLTPRFQLFCEHYRFKPVFMNPESGWEKGNVECKVGYLRHNELVPVPEFESLREFNKELLKRCDEDMAREHYEYDDGTWISDLFKDDREALLPLPSTTFDTARYETASTNKYGKFTLNEGKHIYSVSPESGGDIVNLKITSAEVIVMDSHMIEIIRHRRLYGDFRQESMEWVPYLKYVARHPRSLFNSGIYDLMPEAMQCYMDNCESADRGRILKILSELTDRTGFDSAISTVSSAIRYQATDPDSLMSLYNRTYSDVPLLPPLDRSVGIPGSKIIPINRNDLKALDAALKKGGGANG